MGSHLRAHFHLAPGRVVPGRSLTARVSGSTPHAHSQSAPTFGFSELQVIVNFAELVAEPVGQGQKK